MNEVRLKEIARECVRKALGVKPYENFDDIRSQRRALLLDAWDREMDLALAVARRVAADMAQDDQGELPGADGAEADAKRAPSQPCPQCQRAPAGTTKGCAYCEMGRRGPI